MKFKKFVQISIAFVAVMILSVSFTTNAYAVSNKILVIDDNRVIQRQVRDMLPQGDFDLLSAKDGEEGLSWIRKEHLNLILLDFSLPKVSGWDIFQQIQRDTTFQKIPLVVMSKNKGEVTDKISEPFDYFEFLQKPFEKKELIGAIRSAMSKAKKARPVTQTIEQSSMTLQKRIETLEIKVDDLTKQQNQIITIVKHKLQ